MKALYQPQSGILTVQYKPDADTILFENPPRFTWMAAKLDDDRYVLQISTSELFAEEQTETIRPIPYNLYTPDHVFTSGTYYWRYALLEEDNSAAVSVERSWSVVRKFTVPEGLPETPLPSRGDRYKQVQTAHPRLWLQADDLAHFRQKLQSNPAYCGWSEFYAKSVVPWINREKIAEPQRYLNNKRTASLWRRMYMDCQETLYAIRHLSVAGVVLENRELIEQAKDWLLFVTEWDTEGTTSRDYNDEASFRIAGALAWGYDWLYNELSVEQRQRIRNNLFRRTEQVASHVMESSKIHHVPYDSHAVRSLSSVIVPCCIAMFGEDAKATEWLDYTQEYYAGIYSPWGGQDGGWAEGVMYWTTGMAFVTEAMNLLNKFNGVDFYKRPFFQKTGDFPLYCFSPDTVRASFGDQSSLGDLASLKTGFNIRQFAGVTGNGMYQWYYEQVKRTDVDAEAKFYNYGWWDFRFDEMVYKHDFPEVAAVEPVDAEPIKWFRDVGWVAMHHRMEEPEEHIMLLTKSSRYGSISHSHGDQNGFLLHAFGEPLAIESGYYIAFGSTMHMQWRRQTRSKNNLLIDGKGQFAGTDKVMNMAASGEVEKIESNDRFSYVRSDATAAYQDQVPYLQRYIREIYFVNRSYFVIVDYVDLTQPGKVDWLLHTLYEMQLSRQTFRIQGEKAELDGRFVYCSSGELSLSQTDQFADVDPAEIEGLANHWHLTASTKAATNHRIVTLLVPMHKEEERYVSDFMDDQGHGVHLYFTENGVTQMIEVAN